MPRGWMDEAWLDQGPQPYSRREAYAWLYENARYSDGDICAPSGETVHLLRGQLSHSQRYLGEAWHWGHSRVRRFLEAGVLQGKLVIETAAGQQLITLCDYAERGARIQSLIAVLSDARPFEADAPPGAPGGSATGTPLVAEAADYISEKSVQKHASGAPPGTPGGSATGTNKNKEEERQEGRKEEGLTPLCERAVQPPLFDAATVIPLVDLVQQAFDAWNVIASQHGLPTARDLTPSRRQKIRARLTQAGGPEGWRAALAAIEESFWVKGPRKEAGWLPDLDFLLQPSSFQRAIEGSYRFRPGRGSVDVSAAVAELSDHLREKGLI